MKADSLLGLENSRRRSGRLVRTRKCSGAEPRVRKAGGEAYPPLRVGSSAIQLICSFPAAGARYLTQVSGLEPHALPSGDGLLRGLLLALGCWLLS